jgi:hypothetical protein
MTTKTIVTTTDQTNDFAFALFEPRQLQKIQVSNKFPQTKKKEAEMKLMVYWTPSKTPSPTQYELSLSCARQPHQ